MRAILLLLMVISFGFGAGNEALAQGAGATKRVTVKRYVYDLCLVSDDKLGALGKPIGFAHEGREIKVCCKECRDDFRADPARYMKRLVEWDRNGPPAAKEGMKGLKP